MPKINIDLNQEIPDKPKTRPKIFWKKISIASLIIALIVLAILSSSLAFSNIGWVKDMGELSFLGRVSRLIGAGDRDVKGEKDDKINGLIIGMGGKNHEGGTLADTIILASYKPSTNQVAMLSLPRDLSIKTEKYGWSKINAVHAYAERDNPGQGVKYMITVLNELLDTDIHYYVTVDFNGFEKVIDEFGGVDVYVERNLIDYQYPIRGKEYVYPIENRYEILKIDQGVHHFDGATALKYARSRHALGVEGSDFARAKRQQKIITALKDKILSASTLFNPKRLNSLLSAYQDHINTNMEIWEMLKLAQMGKDLDINNVISHTLSDAPNNFLYSQIINGAYVLLPKAGDFSDIKVLWNNIFYTEGEPLKPTISREYLEAQQKKQATSTLDSKDSEAELKNQNTSPATSTLPAIVEQNENATIEIQNGTWVEGWASKEKAKLTAMNLDVIKTANAVKHDYTQTIIYDLSGGQYPKTAAKLAGIYSVEVISDNITINSAADFVIILGQ